MADDSQLLLTSSTSRKTAIWHWITRTFPGRALTLGAVAKVLALALGLATTGAVVTGVDSIGDISLVTGAVVLAWRYFLNLRRRMLWRVRGKLALSYVFIGFVPVLLTLTFFLIGGMLLLFNVGVYMVKTRLDMLAEQAHVVADAAVLEAERARNASEMGEVLERRQGAVAMRHPLASLVVIAAQCVDGRVAGGPQTLLVKAGPWAHITPPSSVPAWIPCDGYAGLVAAVVGGQPRTAARAVSWVPGASQAVIVDLPIDERIVGRIRAETGVTVGGMTPTTDADTLRGWPALLDFLNWESGEPDGQPFAVGLSLGDVYNRISETSSTRLEGDGTFGQSILLIIGVIGGLFLIIQGVAVLMGIGLARSITGAIHELFIGTERVRRGEFGHRIAIHTRDQIGELAFSFNTMTASIEDLLQQKAEKERLEQELRIARSIQMSLLPQATFSMPGLGLQAHCEPAREVGGDYYDFLPVGTDALGVLVADVSGKGTSAALYMAELKGIVLSLSQLHTSPRQLLIDANRIISRHLDSRSFITVSYVLVDLASQTLRYSRAGHCPMIYVPGPYSSSRAPRVLAPDGMVLGLTIDDGSMFTRLLDEVMLPLGPGDVFLLYTDGVSEAMNADGDCFGDTRLADLVAEHADLSSDVLLATILEQVTEFAGSADQQDDMTMVLIRVEESAT